MYNNIKSCVNFNSTKYEFFVSNIGVRQDTNLYADDIAILVEREGDLKNALIKYATNES